MKYKNLGYIKDDIYPTKPLLESRFCTRGIVVNKEGKIAIIHIKGQDNFGVRDHYELPGGGLEQNESYEECFVREIKEELGLVVNNIKPLGIMSYDFNLIGLHNIAFYFVGYVCGECEKHYTEQEIKLFSEIEWFDLDELINKLEHDKVSYVGPLIHKRELIALKEYKSSIVKG